MEVDEIYWALVAFISDAVQIFITGYFTYRFLTPFVMKKRQSVYAAIIYIIIMLILLLIPTPMSGSVSSAIGFMAVFAAICLADKRNIEQKIYLVLLCYLWEWISWGLIVAVWNFSYDISNLIPAVQESYIMQYAAYVIRQISWLVMQIFITAFIVRLIHRIYINKTENMTRKELVLMLAPVLSVISGRFVFRYFVNVYEIDLKQYVWENHHDYNLLLFLYQLISFAVILTITAMYQSIKEGRRWEKEETVLARQIEDMEKHIAEVDKLYHDIRSLKHDMKNHVMVLENLYGKNEEAMQYAAAFMEEIDAAQADINIKSGNPITDIIISEKQKEAQERGIAFQYEFYYPEGSCLNEFDISVILNNALNNALEAAGECNEPYVRLFSYSKNNTYMIEIRNSITGQRAVDADSGLPFTTKKGEGHGYGLVNIRKMSQKYHGDIDIEQSEKEFTLSIMLSVLNTRAGLDL